MLIQKQYSITIFLFLALVSAAFGQPGNEVIEYNTFIKAAPGKLTVETSCLIQVNNKQSDWITAIEIPYRAGDKLDVLEATVLDRNGKVVRSLKKKEIVSRSFISQGTFFEDSYVSEFDLKWHEYPYRVKYSYRKVMDQFLHVASWYPVLYTNVPTRKASLEVQLPLDYKVNIRFPDAFTYKADTLENSCALSWQILGVEPVASEVFAPPVQEGIPHVKIVPEEFNYELKGSFKSWASYGDWLNRINTGLDVLPQSEQFVVERLTRGITDKRELIKILYHHLQDHTRYINVSIDAGGLKPYPASYVCTNKYGDCKALTIYMKALLKQVGIESFYTIIHADANPVQFEPEFPSHQFNHVVLCVPLDGDTLWLENTTSHLPYNYLGTFTQNRYALAVGNSGSKLVKTPSLSLEDVLENTTYTYALNQEGEGTLNILANLRGEAFENLRYLQHEYSEKDQQRAISESINVTYAEMLSWQINQEDRDLPLLQLQMALKVNSQLRRLGNSLVLSPNALKLPRLESAGSRTAPLRINYPVNKQDSITYLLPFANQYKTKLPLDVAIESKFGRYREQYQEADGRISVKRSFQLFAGNYPIEEYPHFYDFIESVKESQKKSAIVLNPN
ncbi:DUF3857 domain-containing protein [Cesiribacter sp. SM1]|uniref:DUF3857 domain-containing protein n=1 Tax=Cesiribacter sp. SM1 TaxID=2861196 RepID=UPI001CD4D9EF|nr:DUF3857 domain-containing protein [Cesiribacter sp. SM1]